MLLPSSPLLPGTSPVGIHVREAGAGAALLLLHGGWGYEAYPGDVATLPARRRVGAAVLEAFHFLTAKESSGEFFRTAVVAPERFGEGVVSALRGGLPAGERRVDGSQGEE